MFVSNRFPLQAMSLRSFGWLLVGAAPNGSMVGPWWSVISSMAGWEITKKTEVYSVYSWENHCFDQHWSTWGFSSGADYQRVAVMCVETRGSRTSWCATSSLNLVIAIRCWPVAWNQSSLILSELTPDHMKSERRQKKLWASFGALLSRSLWWFPARNGSSTVWDVFFLCRHDLSFRGWISYSWQCTCCGT